MTQTRGNPLALIEVGRELTPAQLTGGDPLPELLPLGPQLEAGFLRQTRDLPAGTQTLLLAAAAEPTGDPALLWRAGRDLGFTPDSGAPAQAGDLVVLGSVIRFRHPLVRSAIYHSAAPIERRRIHKALAAATDPGQDPDRRAWHLSEAAAEPDEGVAAGLEHAADRAMIRGGWAARAAFLTRAAVLSPARGHPGPQAPRRRPRREHRRRPGTGPGPAGQITGPSRRPAPRRPGHAGARGDLSGPEPARGSSRRPAESGRPARSLRRAAGP